MKDGFCRLRNANEVAGNKGQMVLGLGEARVERKDVWEIPPADLCEWE